MSEDSRCPDLNPYCDGSDLLHGDWCKGMAWAERMIARYRPEYAHPDSREAQVLEDAVFGIHPTQDRGGPDV